MNKTSRKFSLDEICALVEINKRKVRYYIQNNLVDRPMGSGKGAYYTHNHIEQLLTIRKWKNAGLSLDRICEIIDDEKKYTIDAERKEKKGGKPLPPPRISKEGTIEVWSHLHIADGVELHIEPRSSGLTPEQIRALFSQILKSMKKLQMNGAPKEE